jgi:hypothetical protein
MHHRGPATVIKLIPGRRRQYEIEFYIQGKTYKRDDSMLVTEQTILEIDVTTLDPTKSQQDTNKPQLYTKGETLHEDKLIICRTETTDSVRKLLISIADRYHHISSHACIIVSVCYVVDNYHIALIYSTVI